MVWLLCGLMKDLLLVRDSLGSTIENVPPIFHAIVIGSKVVAKPCYCATKDVRSVYCN